VNQRPREIHPSVCGAVSRPKQAAPANSSWHRSSIGETRIIDGYGTEALGKGNTLGSSREPPV
jgi:hypothetical protein